MLDPAMDMYAGADWLSAFTQLKAHPPGIITSSLLGFSPSELGGTSIKSVVGRGGSSALLGVIPGVVSRLKSTSRRLSHLKSRPGGDHDRLLKCGQELLQIKHDFIATLVLEVLGCHRQGIAA